MSRPFDSVGSIEGGYDTARVPVAATEADQAVRDVIAAKALRYLTRRDLLDIAEMLGLIEPSTEAANTQNCAFPGCGETFTVTRKRRAYCSGRCRNADNRRLAREADPSRLRHCARIDCGRAFTSDNRARRHCSRSCAAIAGHAAHRATEEVTTDA